MRCPSGPRNRACCSAPGSGLAAAVSGACAYVCACAELSLSFLRVPSPGQSLCNVFFFLSGRDFSWSPGGNIIAFWVPEDKDIPARVTLMQLPTRQEIRVRNLFNVVDCKLHWQKNGDYLCVKVDRTPKGTQVSGSWGRGRAALHSFCLGGFMDFWFLMCGFFSDPPEIRSSQLGMS